MGQKTHPTGFRVGIIQDWLAPGMQNGKTTKHL